MKIGVISVPSSAAAFAPGQELNPDHTEDGAGAIESFAASVAERLAASRVT